MMAADRAGPRRRSAACTATPARREPVVGERRRPPASMPADRPTRVVARAAPPARRAAPARRQVDQPSGADARGAGGRREPDRRAPATARTSARRPGSWPRSGPTVERTSPATAGRVDYRVVSPGADGLARAGRRPRLRQLRDEPAADRRDARRAADDGHVLDGDASLRGRPVARIIEPLRSMGAELHARQNDSLPPLTVVGRTPLRAIEFATPVPSAQVKSAILLAGLRADGRTTVREVGRDARPHGADAAGAGRAGRARRRRGGRRSGLDGRRRADGAGGRRNGSRATSRRRRSGSSRAPSTPTPSSTLRDVGVNPTRRAVIDILRSMGADIEERPRAGRPPTTASASRSPTSSSGRRRCAAIELGPADVAAAIDEIPVLCLAAAAGDAARPTIRGAGELRHKESDRIAGIAAGLRGARRTGRGRRRRPPDRRRRAALDGADDRQPRRPPPGHDLRDRRA